MIPVDALYGVYTYIFYTVQRKEPSNYLRAESLLPPKGELTIEHPSTANSTTNRKIDPYLSWGDTFSPELLTSLYRP